MTSFCILEVHFRAFLSVEKYETNSGNLEVSLVQSLPFLTFWIFIFELIPLWTISVPKYVLGFLMKVRQLFDIGQINQSIVVWCLLKIHPLIYLLTCCADDDKCTYRFRGGASSQSQGGPKAQFCPTFQNIRVLLHFYVTIFWDSQSQGGPRPPWTPWLRRPCVSR